MSFHKLDKARDKNFWSVRVNARHPADRSQDRRACCCATSITTTKPMPGPSGGNWRRIRRRARPSWSRSARRYKEIVVPVYVEEEQPAPKARQKPSVRRPVRGRLLGYGVPAGMARRRSCGHRRHALRLWPTTCPAEAAKRCLELATGGKPRMPPLPVGRRSLRASRRPAAVPRDDQRRGTGSAPSIIPWEKWTVFLHPDQRQWVERDYGGPRVFPAPPAPARRSSHLHRAAHLARTNPDARVLLTTFSDALASACRRELNRLVSSEPRLARAHRRAFARRHRTTALQDAHCGR